MRWLLLVWLLSSASGAAPLFPLERRVEDLDKRVQEIERIRFSGRLWSALISQGFVNRGRSVIVSPDFPQFDGMNLDALVGTAQAANFCYFSPMTPPLNGVLDYQRGTPMTRGTALTTSLTLTVEAELTQQMRGLLTLGAYTTAGDPLVGAFWGVRPPGLADPFVLGLPYQGSRAVLDRFQLLGTNSALSLGSITPEIVPSLGYQGQESPRVIDPSHFLQPVGFHYVERGSTSWEVFGARLPSSLNVSSYQPWMTGAAVERAFDSLTLTASVLRTVDGTSQYGIRDLNGSVVSWVDPQPGQGVVGPGGTLGPQAQTLGVLGLSAELNENYTLSLQGAFCNYQSNLRSSYSSSGGAGQLMLRGRHGEWNYQLEGLWVSPRYDPYLLSYPTPDSDLFYVYWRFPDQSQQANLYSLHGHRVFPHNRRGLRGRVAWQGQSASLALAGGVLEQVETNLFDVRRPGAMGFAPGWFDGFFAPFAPATYSGTTARENPRGRVSFADLSGQWEGFSASYRHWNFARPSSLPGADGSRNYVDLTLSQADAGYNWKLQEGLEARLGLGYHTFQGHVDPNGYFQAAAAQTGRIDLPTIDTHQWVPSLAVKIQLDEQTRWELTYRHFITDDRLNPPPSANGGNVFGPFSWSGSQFISSFEMSF